MKLAHLPTAKFILHFTFVKLAPIFRIKFLRVLNVEVENEKATGGNRWLFLIKASKVSASRD